MSNLNLQKLREWVWPWPWTFKSASVLLKLYKSLVRSHLEYCVSAWSPYYEKDKFLLERIQHRFTRMIPGLKKLPYDERIRQLGLWTLEERRNRADLLQDFKMYKGLSSAKFIDFFTLSMSVTTRGHTAKFAKCRCHLDIRRFFFSSRVRLIGWTVYSKVSKTPAVWIVSRMVSSAQERLRQASLWTNQSA